MIDAEVSPEKRGIYLYTVIGSPQTARLTAWTTCSPREPTCADPTTPLAGTISLTDTELIISPDQPPFALDGCNFEQYTGTFESVVTLGAGP